jgi:hypothetical protein
MIITRMPGFDNKLSEDELAMSNRVHAAEDSSTVLESAATVRGAGI